MKPSAYLALLFFSSALLSSCDATTTGSQGGEKGMAEGDNRKEHVKSSNLVDTMILRRSTFKSQLISNGKLRAMQKSDLRFGTQGGRVMLLNAKNGEWVNAGSLVARLDDRDARLRLEQARQGMAKANIDLQDALLGFGYRLRDTLNVPEETMKIARIRSGYDAAVTTLASAELGLEGTEIRAPFAGRVADLKTKLYEAPKGDYFCSVINDRAFDVEFSVLEGELKGIFVGQGVAVTTFVDLGKKYKGKITAVNPTVDAKGQIAVTASVLNPGDLMDGMNVKVFVENEVKDQLVVPKNAVLVRDNREILFRYDGATGKAMWTYVVIELSNSDSHAVRANVDRGAELNEGDAVIVSGNLNLADGSPVEIIIK